MEGIFALDGEEQDVYIIDCNILLSKFEGTVIAVYHRINDIEDNYSISDQDILNLINFQEQYFQGKLYR